MHLPQDTKSGSSSSRSISSHYSKALGRIKSFATSTASFASQSCPLPFRIMWILGTNFPSSLARVTSPALQKLHETRLQLEANRTHPNPQDSLPELTTIKEATLDRMIRSRPESSTEEAPPAPKSLSWSEKVMGTVISWLWPSMAFRSPTLSAENPMKPITRTTSESNRTEESLRNKREAPVEVTETTPIPTNPGTVDLS